MSGSRRRAWTAVAMLTAGIITVSGCASAPEGAGTAPTATAPGADTAASHVRTGPVTVLDAGDGAELCLGMIATSMPPQCGGPGLVGWDWSQWAGAYAEASGVRWGQFALTGTYDADAFAFTPATV